MHDCIKYILQLGKILSAIWTYTFYNLDRHLCHNSHWESTCSLISKSVFMQDLNVIWRSTFIHVLQVAGRRSQFGQNILQFGQPFPTELSHGNLFCSSQISQRLSVFLHNGNVRLRCHKITFPLLMRETLLVLCSLERNARTNEKTTQ